MLASLCCHMPADVPFDSVDTPPGVGGGGIMNWPTAVVVVVGLLIMLARVLPLVGLTGLRTVSSTLPKSRLSRLCTFAAAGSAWSGSAGGAAASVTMALEAVAEPTEEPRRRVVPEREALREKDDLRGSLRVGAAIAAAAEEKDGIGGGECGGG